MQVGRAGQLNVAGAGRRLAHAVGICVFASGAASLSLEVVWSRLLRLVFGSTTLAVTTILVAYMLGLGIGGLLGGRFAKRLGNGVRAYGWMEVAIGVYALVVPWILGHYPALNRTVLAPLDFWPAAFVRFVFVLGVLALPTILMGATLPILVASLARARSELADRVGLLYGLNTLGAVAGVLGATFLGFRYLGVRGTNTTGALLDVAVGLVAVFVIAPRLASGPATAEEPADEPEPATRSGPRWSLELVSYGLVGFTALAYEVSWTRALAMILGSSVYAFATMLAGFLAGIALGSLVARRWLDALARPVETYARGLFLLGLASLLVLFVFRSLPDVFLTSFASVGISGANLVWLGLAVSFVVMLAPTFVLGALFPLVTRIEGERKSSARAVGDVYFVNTIGSASGAFCAGFVLIPVLGLRTTMALAMAINFLTAAFVFFRATRAEGSGRRTLAAVTAAVAGILVLVVRPSWQADDFALGVYYRSSVRLDFGLSSVPMHGTDEDDLVFYREGINCTVSIHETQGGIEEGGTVMRINGKADASLADLSTQVLSGHLPILFGGRKSDALVIGLASGMTAGSMALHELESIDVCEIEPAVVEASHWFDEHNHRPLEQEGVRLIVEDGRTVLSTSEAAYDVIVSEPSNPWLTGCANLFTKEFFEAAHTALRPGGRLLQWIQLYGMDVDGLSSVLQAMHGSFEHVYGFLYNAQDMDLLLLATDEPLTPEDLPRWEELSPAVRNDLARIRIFSTADLWTLLILLPEDLARLAASARHENTDDSMFVELRAPWYLYDETYETSDTIHEHARGVLPLLAAEGFVWPPGLLGEVALSYLDQRANDRLADAALAALQRRDDRAHLLVLQAEREIMNGRAGEPSTRALLDRAVEAAPGAFSPRYFRGWLSHGEGRLAEARADFEVALGMRPEHLLTRYELMKVLATQDDTKQEALDQAEALLASPLGSVEPRLWAEAAYLAGGFGRFEEAIDWLTHFLELMPYSPNEWRLLATFYELSGLPEKGQDALAKAELAHANLVREYHWLGRWHEQYGSSGEGVLALETALELDPENRAIQDDLARLRAQT
jgi:spermidine synthase